MIAKYPLVILDRDGVINFDSPHFIRTPDEWIPIPGSLQAVARLNKAGCKVAVATNQSGIGRGYYDEKMIDKIHAKMQQMLHTVDAHIDAIFYCPHVSEDKCRCRKPKPGLLKQAFSHFQIDEPYQDIPFIGDSLRDLEAAVQAGCRPILVLTGNGEETAAALPAHLENVEQYPDLATAVDALLQS